MGKWTAIARALKKAKKFGAANAQEASIMSGEAKQMMVDVNAQIQASQEAAQQQLAEVLQTMPEAKMLDEVQLQEMPSKKVEPQNKRFDQELKDYVRNMGGRTKASKESYNIMKQLLKSSEATVPNGRLEKGKLYTFRYFTPDEPYFDSWPVVIGLGKSEDGHQLGINLHYIPYLSRIEFVQSFLNSYGGTIRENTIGTKALNAKLQSPIDIISYESIKSAFGKKFNITYAIRQYMLKRMREPISLCYERWFLGVVNDENYFIGTNINEAQAKYHNSST